MIKHNYRKIWDISRNDKGFTLLEVIMAVSILTVGLLAVASLQVTAMRGNTMSMNYTESTEKVQDLVEKLLSKDYDDADLSDSMPVGAPDGVLGLDDDEPDTADHYIPGDKYRIYWNVAENRAKNSTGWYTVNGLKTIRVIVEWESRGSTKTYKFDLLRNRI